MQQITSIAPQSDEPVGARRVSTRAGEARTDLSKQWIARPHDERFLSLTALRDKVAARRDRALEDRIATKAVEFIAPEARSPEDLHRLTVGLPDGTETAPTHWSFGQLAQLAKAPAGYLRTLPSQIVSDALQYGMRWNREVDQIKTYRVGEQLFAATGPDYGRIYDAEVVEAVMQIAGDGTGEARWKVPGVLDWATGVYDPDAPVTPETTTLYASDRDVFIFLVDDRHPISVGKLPNGEDDLMFRGFYITNSEVGNGALKLAAFYLRAVCCNRIMWGVEGFEELTMRHTKYAPSRFIEEARPALQSFSEGSTGKLLEGVEKARAAKVADDRAEALEWLSNRALSRRRAVEVLDAVEREEGRPARSAWDMAQGISAVARTIPNSDSRVEMELAARKILDKVAA